MDRPDMSTESHEEHRSTDSVDREATAWLDELSGVDPEIEMARMRLRRIGQQSEHMLSDIAQRHDLTLGDWETLSVLRQSGPPYVMTPSELAQALGVTSGTISVRIERLIQVGLIEPAGSTSDGRSRPIRITDEGTRRWRAATMERTSAEARVFQNALGPIEIEYLNQLLRWLMIEMETEFGHGHQRFHGQS